MSLVIDGVDYEDLAARTLAAIVDREQDVPVPLVVAACAADRERVASDLAGLRYAQTFRDDEDARRDLTAHFVANLRRTAALYGVPDDMDAMYERIVQAGRDLGHDL